MDKVCLSHVKWISVLKLASINQVTCFLLNLQQSFIYNVDVLIGLRLRKDQENIKNCK